MLQAEGRHKEQQRVIRQANQARRVHRDRCGDGDADWLLFMYADIPVVQTEKEVRPKGHQIEESVG